MEAWPLGLADKITDPVMIAITVPSRTLELILGEGELCLALLDLIATLGPNLQFQLELESCLS